MNAKNDHTWSLAWADAERDERATTPENIARARALLARLDAVELMSNLAIGEAARVRDPALERKVRALAALSTEVRDHLRGRLEGR